MPSFLAQAAVSMAWLDCAPPVVNTTSAPLRLVSASRSSSTSFGSFFDRPVLLRPRRSTDKPSGPSSRWIRSYDLI